MSRPRTPTAILDARGAFKDNPQRKRPGEPVVTEPIGPPPDHLEPDELKAWREFVNEAPLGVLTAADAKPLELASRLMAESRADFRKFSPGKLGILRTLLGTFGMTPSDRAKMSIAKEPDANPFGHIS